MTIEERINEIHQMLTNPQIELKSNEYQCQMCKGIFEFGWTQEEAEEEAKKAFGDNVLDTKCGLVCDDCYKQIMPTIQQ